MNFNRKNMVLTLSVLFMLYIMPVAPAAQEGMAYREWPVKTVIQVAEDQTQQEVSLKPGEAVRVELFAAGGTGYDWELSEKIPAFLQPVYTSSGPAGNASLDGGPVRTVYIVKVSDQGQGSASVSFLLRRPWEKTEPPARNFKLTVQINSQGGLSPEQTLLRKDGASQDKLPEDFRVVEEVKASGSAQYSEQGLARFKEALPDGPVFLVDLRQESHGFVNGIPVSWYGERNWANLGKSADEVQIAETEALAELASSDEVLLYKKLKLDKVTGELLSAKSEKVEVKAVSSEEQLAQSLGLGYFRLAVTDHRRPLDNEVDRFIEFVRDLPPNAWLHFHCEAGHGRTTTFLAMYDMMLNAKRDSLEDIIVRQRDAGGIDLFAKSGRDWRAPYDEERIAFIKSFYDYCKGNRDQFTTSWSAWQEQNKAKNLTDKIPDNLSETAN